MGAYISNLGGSDSCCLYGWKHGFSTTVRRGNDPADRRFRPRYMLQLKMYGRIHDPRVGPSRAGSCFFYGWKCFRSVPVLYETSAASGVDFGEGLDSEFKASGNNGSVCTQRRGGSLYIHPGRLWLMLFLMAGNMGFLHRAAR